MNYLTIYNETKVLSCDEFAPGTGVVSPDGINILINSLETTKTMLDAAGIDYSNFSILTKKH